MNEGQLSTVFRSLLFLLGIIFSLPLIVALLLLPRTPLSSVGVIYLFSYFLIVLGLVCALWWDRALAFTLLGSILLLTTVVVRVLSPASGSQLNIMTLPGGAAPRALTRILNEQDAVLFGAQLSPYVGFVSPVEAESLLPAFVQTYDEMNASGATPLSPFLTTYLNQQHPEQFDVVIAEPADASPKRAVIFLHGFGGNFTVQCWLIAKAAYSIDALTVCPSTGPSGHWWSAQGQAILRETLSYLHQRGVERVYLAGLSNGGIGASRLADGFKGELAGLILISGADPGATVTKLPVLVLHGVNDERIPASFVEQYVSVAGPHIQYQSFDGDHFLLLKKAGEVQEVIANWLRGQESTK